MRILLVEDSAADARVVLALVRAAAPDANVEIAPSLSAARALLATHAFDAALVDLQLPDARGLDTIARVREDAPALPLVVLTGEADEALGVEAVRRGAEDYLVKGSHTAASIVRSLRFAIERHRRAGAPTQDAILRDVRRHLDILDAEKRALRRFLAPRDPDEPLVADRYALKRLLGRGSSGEAWLGRDVALGRDVCVKLLHAQDEPDAARRFAREARVMAALEHPNIVRVYDFGEADDRPFLVMEYVPNGSLADRLARQGSFAPADAARTMRALLAGLEHVHGYGLLHRDLKPANVLLGSATVQLCDFGLALAPLETLEHDATQVGLPPPPVAGGTPAYMSPEAALAAPLDARSDVYSAGAILYHLLAGRPYLDLEGSDAFAARRAIVDREPEPLEGGLARVALDALQKDPARRPASAHEMRARIEAAAPDAR